jgi:hypothetical protein
MAIIHFFAGAVLSDLIRNHFVPSSVIENAFQSLRKNSDHYFDGMIVYPISNNVDKINNSEYKNDDILVVASAGGTTLNTFIQRHGITHPKIAAFEAYGIESYGENVWHFMNKQNDKGAFQGIKLYWEDNEIGHNAYMINPFKQTICHLSELFHEISNPFHEISKTFHAATESKKHNEAIHYRVYDDILVENNDSKNKKILKKVLIRCDDQGSPISVNPAAIIMDLIISAAYARKIKNIRSMPKGFSIEMNHKHSLSSNT